MSDPFCMTDFTTSKGNIVRRACPVGWRLVLHNEPILSDDRVVRVFGPEAAPNKCELGPPPVGHWLREVGPRVGLFIEPLDTQDRTLTTGTQGRIARRLVVVAGLPNARWKGCMHRREEGATFCPVCAFSGRITRE